MGAQTSRRRSSTPTHLIRNCGTCGRCTTSNGARSAGPTNNDASTGAWTSCPRALSAHPRRPKLRFLRTFGDLNRRKIGRRRRLVKLRLLWSLYDLNRRKISGAGHPSTSRRSAGQEVQDHRQHDRGDDREKDHQQAARSATQGSDHEPSFRHGSALPAATCDESGAGRCAGNQPRSPRSARDRSLSGDTPQTAHLRTTSPSIQRPVIGPLRLTREGGRTDHHAPATPRQGRGTVFHPSPT